MSGASFRILVLGASGAFGSRLSLHLAAAGLDDILLVARGESGLRAIRDALLKQHPNARVDIAARERAAIDAGFLARSDIALVIDAAGPFQSIDLAIPRAAIAARCHYLDLADGRAFVVAIGALDEEARAAGVAVLSGASSTPALSHAALDELTRNWRRIDGVRAGIFPGCSAPRGLSLIQAILSWTGRTIRVFRDGDWRIGFGWENGGRVAINSNDLRSAALADTPDLDLFVARYKPRIEALFFAGLESTLMHRGVAFLARCVRIGLLRDASRLATSAKWMSDRLPQRGADRGAMIAEATGCDALGEPTRARWTLVAEAGRGPNVPALPAVALARRLAQGALDFRGAAPAAGHLRLADFDDLFARVGATTSIAREPLAATPLFQRALGKRFDRLPAVTRLVHSPQPALVLSGTAETKGAQGWPARLIARLFRFPPTRAAVPARVIIRAEGDGERWVRLLGEDRFESQLSPAGDGAVHERFGPARFRLRLDADGDGLAMTPVAGWFGPIPIPRALLPAVSARESVTPSGEHRFDVKIAAPLVGLLVHYRGAVRPEQDGP